MKVDPALNIPNQQSAGSQWIEWHKELKAYFGIRQANALWLKNWHKQGNTFNANTAELRDYLSNNGIKIEGNIFSDAYDLAMTPFDAIADFLKIGKYAAIGVGVIILGGLALTVYNIAKKPNATIGALKR